MKPRQPRPVSVDRIERALDTAAALVVKRGEAWLPAYDYFEKLLQEYRAKEDRIAAARARFTRSQDRTAAQS